MCLLRLLRSLALNYRYIMIMGGSKVLNYIVLLLTLNLVQKSSMYDFDYHENLVAISCFRTFCNSVNPTSSF